MLVTAKLPPEIFFLKIFYSLLCKKKKILNKVKGYPLKQRSSFPKWAELELLQYQEMQFSLTERSTVPERRNKMEQVKILG